MGDSKKCIPCHSLGLPGTPLISYIFHDSTLIALASRRPQSLEALAEIPGMGERKIERYGAAILAILRGEDSVPQEG